MNHWALATSARFDKELSRLDRRVARRVIDYLEALATIEDPRTRGKGLTGDLVGHWRYRVGDYRVLARITPSDNVVLLLAVAHRSEIYDR